MRSIYPNFKSLISLLVLLLLAVTSLCVRGHQVSTVEFEFHKLETQWQLRGEMDVAYMLPETRKQLFGGPMSREELMKSDM